MTGSRALFGGGVGFAVGLLAGWWLWASEAGTVEPAGKVVVASRWLADFDRINEDSIEIREVPLSEIDQGVVSDKGQVVGRSLKVPVEAGQAIRKDNLYPPYAYDKEGELLRFAYAPALWSAPGMDELITGDEQLHPASTTFREIQRRVEEYLMDAGLFQDAFEKLKLSQGTLVEDHIFQLNYQLGGKGYRAHSYFTPTTGAVPASNCAALIIPGSGHNASSEIHRRDPGTYYRDIVGLTERYCDAYVFVKPNEDFVAIHNGEKKLSYDFIIPYLLNRGGSYSALYIVHSLAITKYLKQKYQKTFVLGLSQGAQAALWNVLQSEPTGAVISSGLTVIDREVNYGWGGGIIIPGLWEAYPLDRIRSIMEASRTQFLLTYGRQEYGTFRIEAEEGYTCKFLEAVDNVTCSIHEGGHTFPPDLINGFLAGQVAR